MSAVFGVAAALTAMCCAYALWKSFKRAKHTPPRGKRYAVTPFPVTPSTFPIEPVEHHSLKEAERTTADQAEKRARTPGEVLADDLLFEAIVKPHRLPEKALADDILSSRSRSVRTPGQILADDLLLEAMGDAANKLTGHPAFAQSRVRRLGRSAAEDGSARFQGVAPATGPMSAAVWEGHPPQEAQMRRRQKKLRTGDPVESSTTASQLLDDSNPLGSDRAVNADQTGAGIQEADDDTRWAFVREEHLHDVHQIRTKSPGAIIADDLLLEAMAT